MTTTTRLPGRAVLLTALGLVGLSSLLPALAGSAAIRSVANTLLDNPGFEGNYNEIAPGWEVNSWEDSRLEAWLGYWIPALQNTSQATPVTLLVPEP